MASQGLGVMRQQQGNHGSEETENHSESQSSIGMVTATKETYLAHQFIAFVVTGQLVLVLDRKDVQKGLIIGMLLVADVALAGNVEHNWIMLPEGSYVRHPKVREGRIKLKRDGWLVLRHEKYGEMMAAFGAEKVRKLYETKSFAKLPMVKLAKKKTQPKNTNGRASAASAARDEDEEEDIEEEQNHPVLFPEQVKDQSEDQRHADNTSVQVDSSLTAGEPLEEKLNDHIATCHADHWKVVHQFVNIRSVTSVTGAQLGVVCQGNIICVGNPISDRGKASADSWVALGKDAKVWVDFNAKQPRTVFSGARFRQDRPTEGYVLTNHEVHGELIRFLPRNILENWSTSTNLVGSAGGQATGIKSPELSTADATGPAKPVEYEFSKTDTWVVTAESANILAARHADAHVDVGLQKGDVLFLGDVSKPKMIIEPSKTWLQVPPGAQVLRRWELLLSGGCTSTGGFVLVHDGEDRYLKPGPDDANVIRVYSGFGEPWAVEHEQVVVRRGPSTLEVPVGIMKKGDVVGVRRKNGNWLQLTQDSEVRFRRKNEGDAISEINSVNNIREMEPFTRKITLHKRWSRLKIRGTADADDMDDDEDSAIQMWMLEESKQHGQLLRRCRKRKGGLGNGCVISEQRLLAYREVVDLCHRRIYEENLEGLWDGEREKLPTKESVEAKLFDGNTTVIHVTVDSRMTGGAIIKEFSVRAKQLEGNSNINLMSTTTKGSTEETMGTTTVCYIDSCASEPGSGSGRRIWDFVSSMKFACVACHSILLQDTVDFWQARGMRRRDPAKQSDCEEFQRMILVHTLGKVVCELKDLQQALPSSKLPLFVWIPTRFNQDADDPHIFTPDKRLGSK